MRFVSPLLKHVVYPTIGRTGWIQRSLPASGCAVVNYHGVLPDGYSTCDAFLDGNLVSRETLRRQIRLLKNRYNVVSPDEFHNWIAGHGELPTRAVLITCDDGLLNTLTDMLPILASEDVRCIFFVLGLSCRPENASLWYEDLYFCLANERNGIGDSKRVSTDLRARWWQAVQEMSGLDFAEREDRIRKFGTRREQNENCASVRRWSLLNADQLKLLHSSGMEIGSHTLSHPVLSACSEDLARREIEESKPDLENLLNKPVWAFAYPFGNPGTMGDREVRLAREAGFACAFVNTGGGNVDRSQPFRLSRTHVTADMNLAEFEAHVSGLHNRLQRAVLG